MLVRSCDGETGDVTLTKGFSIVMPLLHQFFFKQIFQCQKKGFLICGPSDALGKNAEYQNRLSRIWLSTIISDWSSEMNT